MLRSCRRAHLYQTGHRHAHPKGHHQVPTQRRYWNVPKLGKDSWLKDPWIVTLQEMRVPPVNARILYALGIRTLFPKRRDPDSKNGSASQNNGWIRLARWGEAWRPSLKKLAPNNPFFSASEKEATASTSSWTRRPFPAGRRPQLLPSTRSSRRITLLPCGMTTRRPASSSSSTPPRMASTWAKRKRVLGESRKLKVHGQRDVRSRSGPGARGGSAGRVSCRPNSTAILRGPRSV